MKQIYIFVFSILLSIFITGCRTEQLREETYFDHIRYSDKYKIKETKSCNYYCYGGNDDCEVRNCYHTGSIVDANGKTLWDETKPESWKPVWTYPKLSPRTYMVDKDQAFVAVANSNNGMRRYANTLVSLTTGTVMTGNSHPEEYQVALNKAWAMHEEERITRANESDRAIAERRKSIIEEQRQAKSDYDSLSNLQLNPNDKDSIKRLYAGAKIKGCQAYLSAYSRYGAQSNDDIYRAEDCGASRSFLDQAGGSAWNSMASRRDKADKAATTNGYTPQTRSASFESDISDKRSQDAKTDDYKRLLNKKVDGVIED